MKEKTPRSREFAGGPGGPGIFDEFEDASAMARVSTDLYDEELPIANSTVGEVRARHRDRLGISPESTAHLDGEAVDDSTVIRANQVLSFSVISGVKGIPS